MILSSYSGKEYLEIMFSFQNEWSGPQDKQSAMPRSEMPGGAVLSSGPSPTGTPSCA